ncbi:MAG: VOC family protein [Mucilaginibacter sp.]
MLIDKKVKAFVITSNAGAAKKFYGEVLGFKLLSEDDYGLEFEMNGSLLRVSVTAAEHAVPQKHTVLGWCVPDINETVESLTGKGITFERYEFLQQEDNGVWEAPGGTKIAWFKDPNCNVLSVDQKG